VNDDGKYLSMLVITGEYCELAWLQSAGSNNVDINR